MYVILMINIENDSDIRNMGQWENLDQAKEVTLKWAIGVLGCKLSDIIESAPQDGQIVYEVYVADSPKRFGVYSV